MLWNICLLVTCLLAVEAICSGAAAWSIPNVPGVDHGARQKLRVSMAIVSAALLVLSAVGFVSLGATK